MKTLAVPSASEDRGSKSRFFRDRLPSDDSDAARRRLLEIADLAGLQLAHGRRFELIHSGDRHFERLIAAIEGAAREVCLEMYQVRADPVGWGLCSALAGAAVRGVEVRLLVDRLGSAPIGPWFETLRRHGVSVEWYRPWRPWSNPFRRTHRKLVVVDGETASVGGMNIAAEFSDLLSAGHGWRDVSLWLEGPAAWALRRQFEVAWVANGGSPGRPLPVPDGRGTLCALCNPSDTGSNQADAYRALVATAREELLLATPYFLPSRQLRAALAAAVQRGVDVTVVVPRLNDVWWFKHGSRRHYGELLDRGVAIWERRDRMVHAKVAVADGLIAAVGSTNLNRLSFYGNSETLLLTAEQQVVREIRLLIGDESHVSADRLAPQTWLRHPDRQPWAEVAATAVAMLL